MTEVPAVQHAPAASDATQEIRLAVVLNGGVSLAVWISGVAHELNNLVQASRRGTPEPGAPDVYAELLGVLQATARIDVIAGTSAGGINGGFLALGLVRGCDLSGLRTLWQDQGDLGTLLRDPREKDAPSLLRGEYFHEQLAQAYHDVWGQNTGLPADDDEDVDLFLTGTLWEGRRSFFADDMGRRITEVDYDATFHFTSDPETLASDTAGAGDLTDQQVTAQLGVASRCTASFPAAFEPFPVTVPEDTVRQADGRWPSDAGRANFQRSQFVIDGGILRNKPIRPAIDAVYEQPAGLQVRRILAYVVPDPGEAATGPGKPAVTELPGAVDVLLGVMTRLRSTDSVAGELSEIDERNQETAQRRRARDRLAQILVDAAGPESGGTDLVRAAYPGYLEVRRADLGASVARRLLSRAGQPPWSEREVSAELRDLAGDVDDLPFLPQRDVDEAFAAEGPQWRWGHATVRRLGDVVLDVLKRAVWLAPMGDGDRSAVVAQRRATHDILQSVRRERFALDDFWRRQPLPGRSGALAATPGELLGLRGDLRKMAGDWVRGGTTPDAGTRLQQLAMELAGCLHAAGPALRAIAAGAPAAVDDEKQSEQQRLRALVRLLVPTEDTPVADVLHRMLRLEVVHVAFTGVSDIPEQAVELVQMSSLNKALITGIQLNHFGAFYRRSWRANDWLRGRLDGSEQLVQMLLAPERLRQLYERDATTVMARLRDVAIGPADGVHRDALVSAWNVWEPQVLDELEVLQGTQPLPRTFPVTAARIANRLRTEFLPAELTALAAAVTDETDPVTDAVQWAHSVGPALHRNPPPPPSELRDLLDRSEVVARQTITQEFQRGSDTFARTASHAAATLTATASSMKKPKAAVALFTALRGYALLLYTLINFLAGRSNVGRNLTSLVIGVGGTLIALAVVLPGVPLGLPLTGIVIVLAAATAAVLLPGGPRGRGLGWRVALLLLAAVIALAGVLWKTAADAKQSPWELLVTVLIRLAPVVLVLAVGWFLGRPRQKDDVPSPGTPSA
ncbi:MAG TPA: patatin-like protein [Blastococcus sp.]|nr:patatin-like protein [Blastococcus sp.]